ncbi:MAG: hypothetical protein HY684_07755 [Chloroflexi bacterium]|nr:hypothetical protein [Chloroflexota bacterium]
MEISPLQLVGLIALVVAAYFAPRFARSFFERLVKRQGDLLRDQRDAEERKSGGPPQAQGPTRS